MPEDYAAVVREHYEELPYPFRDPEKEGENFYAADGFSLDAFSHFGWAGRRDLRHDARILIAGCGTGDTTIFLAEQLLGGTSELVAIDISAASIAIAKARLAKRGLADRVQFHHLSILDVPMAGLGQFDVIESSGVLHHLPDPDAGLAALASVLAEDGLMAIMVYAKYGRFSVYLVQELMRAWMEDAAPRAQKIEIAREFLNQVPSSHWLTVKNENFIEDMRWPDGSGIYDLFLHSTDRAYTVPELYRWMDGAGLTLCRFFGEFTDDSLYQPESYTPSPLLRSLSNAKTEAQRHAIAELMHGSMAKHYFYAAKQEKSPAQLADDMVVSYAPLQWLFASFVDALLAALKPVPFGQTVQVMPRPFAHSPALQVVHLPHTQALLRAIDGKASVGRIVDSIAQSVGAPISAVRHDFEALIAELRQRQLVFFRHRSLEPYPTAPQIVARFNALRAKQ